MLTIRSRKVAWVSATSFTGFDDEQGKQLAMIDASVLADEKGFAEFQRIADDQPFAVYPAPSGSGLEEDLAQAQKGCEYWKRRAEMAEKQLADRAGPNGRNYANAVAPVLGLVRTNEETDESLYARVSATLLTGMGMGFDPETVFRNAGWPLREPLPPPPPEKKTGIGARFSAIDLDDDPEE